MAIDLPSAVSEELAEWARRAASAVGAGAGTRSGLRLLDAEALHLTLCFLGSRPVGEVQTLGDALAACAEESFELSVGAPVWLPPRRPRTLAVEIRDSGDELVRVQERVSAALAGACDWRPERRRFRPHITLARLRASVGRARRSAALAGVGGDVAGAQPLPATPRLGFRPEAIVLYRSWLAPEGASYQALRSRTLMGG